MLNLLSCTMVYESIVPKHKVSLCKLAVLCTHHREVRHPISDQRLPKGTEGGAGSAVEAAHATWEAGA